MKILICTLFLSFCLPLFAKEDFKYESSQDSGMGKYERIGKIEEFLSKLGRNMDQLKDGLGQEFDEGLEKVKKDLDKIKKEDLKKLNEKLNRLTKTEINNLKKSFQKFQKDDVEVLKKKVEDQDKLIKKLEKEVESLNLTLKSLVNSPKAR